MSKSKKLIIGIIHHLTQLLPFVLVVVVGVPVIGMAYTESTKLLGLRTIPVQVVGTGSMYPSLFWASSEGGPEDETQMVVEEYRTTPHLYRLYAGLTLAGHTYLHRSIGFGDIVSFKNQKTAQILSNNNKDTSSGFIKRVIALPGDTIELRDGFVYRNGTLLSEPYIVSPRSTYGGTTLKECTRTIVPDNSYFVLGDNRKVSSDSRFELGFIKESDIEFILPYNEQKIYRSLWRDTSGDSDLLGSPTLSSVEFIDLVNAERAKKKLSKLSQKPLLVRSATTRGEHLLSDDQTSYDMQTAMTKSGYSNITLGEFVSYGHYTAKELLENILYNASSASQIMDKDFSDIGIADVNREIDGCPSQIIVGHLGGYIPPEYSQDTIDSWTSLRDNLVEIIPSWERALDHQGIDQNKLKELLSIFRRRLSLSEEILSTMTQKNWLSDDQQTRIKADANDASIAEQLSKELNKQ